MFLKNYTSDVPVHLTIGRIEQVLLQCGVNGIMKEYGPDAKITAITFRLPGPDGKPLHIRLPADEDQATEALWRDYCGKVKRPHKKKEDFADQGARTAWRLVKDWVEIEMSRLQLGQADIVEIFLSYVHDGRQTFYEALKEQKYAGLLKDSK
jgi:hypothetical protein